MLLPNHKPLADIAAGVAIGAPTWAWLTNATGVAQFLASVIAIISGMAATYYYVVRALAIRRMRNRPESSDTVTKD